MCPAGLQGTVRYRQVHQLTQGTDVGCGLLNDIWCHRYHQLPCGTTF